jgi:hypothetical protein
MTLRNGDSKLLDEGVSYQLTAIKNSGTKGSKPPNNIACKIRYIIIPADFSKKKQIERDTENSLNKLKMLSIFPNPFNQSVSIKYTLDTDTPVTIYIVDMKGNIVRNLVNDFKNKGVHTTSWEGTNKKGKLVQNGYYLCKIITSKLAESLKIIYLKK